jgi:hypothetical protein
MGRVLWPLATVAAFVLGLAIGAMVWKDAPGQTAARLQQHVDTLQARLRARDELAISRQPAASNAATGASATNASPAKRFVGVAIVDERTPAAGTARESTVVPRPNGPVDRAPSSAVSRDTAGPPTVHAALDRFYRYLEATKGTEGRERWQQVRELTNELRGMGEVAGQALMHVLATGTDSDERRAAARLLGTLQVPQALPLLRDVIDKDGDLLLRRAAAAGLRQLQTPDSIPVMERILVNPAEDRFVRLSAASGLADSGRPLGVAGLAHIFEESNADGRGREIAFRALASLNDDRPLPFMRQLVTSQAEPAYRLRAIRYLTTQGDRQALAALQQVMHAPNEQPSIRDAAAQAYTALGGR